MRHECQPRKGRITAMASRKESMAEAEFPGDRLRAVGLRPTRQRRLLAGLLFGQGDRHVTAELLHREAEKSGCRVALATVYNTLHQFTAAGLLRQVAVDPSRSYFDTNTDPHHHFYDEDDGALIDISGEHIAVSGLPAPPPGMALAGVDVIVRIRRG
jgi:Fur family iron response transcriptional regulator